METGSGVGGAFPYGQELLHSMKSFISSKHRISDILADVQGNLSLGEEGELLLQREKAKEFSNYVRHTLNT